MQSNTGIITLGGGRYLPFVYCMIRQLRHVGSNLPITVYYLGEKETPPAKVISGLDCHFVNAGTTYTGWGAKPACILASPYRHVMFLDSDVFLYADGSWMFQSSDYLKHGNLFWPDHVKINKPMWKEAGVPYRKVINVDSGMILVDRDRYRQQLIKAAALVAHPAWRYSDGDACCFVLSWEASGESCHRVQHQSVLTTRATIQHDLRGDPWAWHITRKAKNKIKLAYNVKGHPDCQTIRKFIHEYNALTKP